ncbi:MAG: T9SS type A sorting domain-containing protein [Candidatus Krumholzibacteriota bacterium]|nr:T9SS type A sorting domain-containing protein [Candidatus Krumholzibacteriota bacterium]
MQSRLLVGFVVLTLVIAGAIGQAQAEKHWVSVNGSLSAERPKAEVINSNESETLIKLTITGFWLDTITEEGTIYHLLRFPGYATTQDVGKAELPVINEYVAIPARAGVRAEIVDFEEITYDGYNVHPFQKVLQIGEKRTSFDIDRAFYAENRTYPEAVRVSEPGIWRDLRLVNLRIAPVRFNPASGELSVYTSVTVRLEYTGENSVNAKMQAPKVVSPRQAALYDRLVLNYDESALPVLGAPPVDNSYDLLIIAEDRFTGDLDEFETWKQQNGYKTKLVPVSTVGTTALEIRNFVVGEYQNCGISYLLLVGTEEPAENPIPFLIYDNNGTASDYAYGTLEGADWYPEIGVGRFSVTTDTELANIVEKSITFESDPPEGDWLGKAALVASQEGAPNGFQGCMEDIRLAEYTQSGKYYSVFQPEFIKVYGALSAYGGTGATNQTLINTINAGVRMVGYYGHGMGYEWSDWNYLHQNFYITDLDQLDNAGQTPIVVAMACLTAAPCAMGGSLGERFTRRADGAVAYHGSTNVTITINEYVQAVFSAIYDIGTPAISDATNEANMWTMRNCSLWEDHARRFIWYGDPTLRAIYRDEEAQTPVLTYPEWGGSVDPGTVTLDWEDVGKISGNSSWPTAYLLQLDNNPDFSSPIIDLRPVASQWTTPELATGTYYWRVCTYFQLEYGPWSEQRHFFVGIPTAATTLVSPADRAMVKPVCSATNVCTTGLGWQNPYSPPGYLLEIDDDNDFSSPVVRVTTSTGGYTLDVEGMSEGTKYYWRVCGIGTAAWPWSGTRSFTLGEAKSDPNDPDPNIPVVSYPNPFNPSTLIRFELPEAMHVRLDIYNVSGQLVATLEDGFREAGIHDMPWNGMNSSGVSVGSGVYFYRLQAGEAVITKKMLLLR